MSSSRSWRVVTTPGAPEGLLQVHVPAVECALRAVPEDPDRVRVARALQHQDAVTLPAGATVPRMAPVRCRERALRERERRALGDVGREELRRIAHDDDGELDPRPAVVQHLAAQDHLALRPHPSPSVVAAGPTRQAAASAPRRSAPPSATRRGDHAVALGANPRGLGARPDPELGRLLEAQEMRLLHAVSIGGLSVTQRFRQPSGPRRIALLSLPGAQ